MFSMYATRMMIEHMDGKSNGNRWLESLLAEGYISLLELVAPSDGDMSAQMDARDDAWRAAMKELQHLHADAELHSRPAVTAQLDPGEAPENGGACRGRLE